MNSHNSIMNHSLPLPHISTQQFNRMNSPQMNSISPQLTGDFLGVSGQPSTAQSSSSMAFLNHKAGGVSGLSNAPAAQLMGLNDLKAFQQLFQQRADHTAANSVLQSLLQQQGQMNAPPQSLCLTSSAGMFGGNASTLPSNLVSDSDAFQSTSLLLQKQLLMNCGNPLNAAAASLLNGNQAMNAMNMNNNGLSGSAGASNDLPLPSPSALFGRDTAQRKRGGVIEPFPEKLHRLLLEVEAAGRSDVISFVANGRAFAIHKPEIFFKEIVPYYFRQSRLSSFKRQLNLYGFELITTGPARGGYYHESFVRDNPEQCRKMRRVMANKQTSKTSTSSISSHKED